MDYILVQKIDGVITPRRLTPEAAEEWYHGQKDCDDPATILDIRKSTMFGSPVLEELDMLLIMEPSDAISRLSETCTAALRSLRKMLELFRNTPSLQGREHIPLGLQVHDTIHQLEAVLPDCIKARLEYLRGELRAERISYEELAELQSLVEHIDPSDTELLEAAGVSEEEYRANLARRSKAPAIEPGYDYFIGDGKSTRQLRDGDELFDKGEWRTIKLDEHCTGAYEGYHYRRKIAGEWQPIAEAPMNPEMAIRVIGSVGGHSPHVIGDVYYGYGPMLVKRMADQEYLKERLEVAWRYSQGGDKVPEHLQPTHFQHLPDAPAKDGPAARPASTDWRLRPGQYPALDDAEDPDLPQD